MQPLPLINRLIRAYASQVYNRNYGVAWSDYYSQLYYKNKINLKSRKTKSGKRCTMLSLLKPTETTGAVKLAVAMCRNADVPIEMLIEIGRAHV